MAWYLKVMRTLKPPSRERITAEAAGVDRRPSLPIQILFHVFSVSFFNGIRLLYDGSMLNEVLVLNDV